MSALIQKQRNNSMNRKISASLSNQALVLATALSLAGVGQAQEPKTLYPRIAPIDQYLMADQNAEIALARSAAPDEAARTTAHTRIAGPAAARTPDTGLPLNGP
jgi:hypothetical protein